MGLLSCDGEGVFDVVGFDGFFFDDDLEDFFFSWGDEDSFFSGDFFEVGLFEFVDAGEGALEGVGDAFEEVLEPGGFVAGVGGVEGV